MIIAKDKMESTTPTPYAVRCNSGCNRGQLLYLTPECYDWQMNRPDALWRCPRCLALATWDDANYEHAFGLDVPDDTPDENGRTYE